MSGEIDKAYPANSSGKDYIMSAIANLATRNNSGLFVSLDYDSDKEEIMVSVKSETADFILYPPNHRALDCYRHPFAYADHVLMTGRYDCKVNQ
jgi:hypothetical protein